MEFEEGSIKQGYLKVAIYGGPGSGKTKTAMTVCASLEKASGARTGIIDTERGSDWYMGEYTEATGKPPFVGHTRNIYEALVGVEDLLEKGCGQIIVDQISHLWEAAQEQFVAGEHEKESKIWKIINETGQIPWYGWKGIKKPYRQLVHKLLSAPAHVFILGRMAVVYKTGEDGEPVKIGEKMAAEKDTPYEPSILVKMEFNKVKKIWLAYVEKDRTGTIQGELFKNAQITGMFDKCLAKLGTGQAQIPEIPEGLARGGYSPEPPNASQVKLISVLTKKGGIDSSVVGRVLSRLNEESAGEVINRLTKKDLSDFVEEG